MANVNMSPVSFLLDEAFDLEEMSLDELYWLNGKVTLAKRTVIEFQKAVAGAIRVRQMEEQARKEVEAMDPAKRRAMAQVLSGAGGIESQEKVMD